MTLYFLHVLKKTVVSVKIRKISDISVQLNSVFLSDLSASMVSKLRTNPDIIDQQLNTCLPLKIVFLDLKNNIHRDFRWKKWI